MFIIYYVLFKTTTAAYTLSLSGWPQNNLRTMPTSLVKEAENTSELMLTFGETLTGK